MGTPRFSILIGTTGSKYLEQIADIFLGSAQSCEVILVVDNPDCRIEDFLADTILQDARMNVLKNDTNIGLTRSLNRGLAVATGDIIVRTDDDDIPDASRLDELSAYYDAHPDADIVFSHARGVDPSSGREWLIDGPVDHAGIANKLARRNFIVHSSVSFKKSSLEPLGFYNEAFRYAQDYELYLRALRNGLRFGCVPKVLVTRQYLPTSITVSKRKRQILHSMAARLLHCAQSDGDLSFWPTLLQYAVLLATPNWARQLRRSLGRGK